jgi:hypothetical protein
MPGVVHVVTSADVPGVNGYGVKVRDQTVLGRMSSWILPDPHEDYLISYVVIWT